MNNAALPTNALTTEQAGFNRQTGLQSSTASLSLQGWDVDPAVVARRLAIRPISLRATTDWSENAQQ